MRWTPLMTAALLVAIPLPVAAAEEASCSPRSAEADALTTPDGQTYYSRYVATGQAHFELWKETNGEPGFQDKASLSCGGKADTLEESFCLSRFCLLTL